MSTSTDQVNPSKEGWPAAIATLALAAALWGMAWMIHVNTYQSPNDVLAPAGHEAAPAAEH
jgi:hypothetical protein